MNGMFSNGFKATAGLLMLGVVLAIPAVAETQTNSAVRTRTASAREQITRPLSLADAMSIARQNSAAILKAQNDLEATLGIVIQRRSIALPSLNSRGDYTYTDPSGIENFPTTHQPNQNWNVGLEVAQSIYEGGRLGAAIRASRLTKEQALLNYQTVVSDTLLATRIAYYDVLLAEQQITVNEASVNLLGKEFEDQQRRLEAGTVPRFNALRAEVAVANARPNLIRARNAYRVAKNNLSNLLGYNLPREIWDDIPLQLTDKLNAEPYQVDLPTALAQALEKRTELAALRKTEQLQEENIRDARAGYQPSLQAFAGYGWQNARFSAPVSLDHAIHGWDAGVRLNWAIFDGFLTRGKVIQARAERDRAHTDLDDNMRQIELQVRTAYSTFIESQEVLQSQEKVQEQAEEALRLSRARSDAGVGTQLDVLNAETQLTQSRTTQIQALHDYSVARARLERATGQTVFQAGKD